MRQLIFISCIFAAVKTSRGMLKVSALSHSTTSFTVMMLASISSGSNIGQKQVLFFCTMVKNRSSSALEWGVVKISLTTFQRREKRRAFSAWSFISSVKLQSEFNLKSPLSVFHDSTTWSEMSRSWSNVGEFTYLHFIHKFSSFTYKKVFLLQNYSPKFFFRSITVSVIFHVFCWLIV